MVYLSLPEAQELPKAQLPDVGRSQDPPLGAAAGLVRHERHFWQREGQEEDVHLKHSPAPVPQASGSWKLKQEARSGP